MNAEHAVPSDEMGPALTSQKPKPKASARDDVPSSGELGPARRSPAADDRTDEDTRARSDPSELTMPPMPKRVGGFTVIDALGMGGMGHVYLARQDSLERLVAVKVLRNELAKDHGYLERFQREAKAAAMFQHPHVVSVIDTGHDAPSNLYYIAFEYVDGGSLESLVRANGALPERRSLEITRAIALALQFAESRRLVHRDLKPANILIAADGTPKLADLGLVRQAERVGPQVTQDGIILGTPLYMAPEQALGRDIDVRADIYALGLCLFRMLTGRTPFNEAEDTCSTLAILSRHVNEELPSVREFVKEVQESTVRLITDMTARDVERRYRSAAHVAQDIERVLAGQQPLGARSYMAPSESDAPTTALTGIRPEDLQKKDSARTAAAAGAAPTVAAAVVLPAAPVTQAAKPAPVPASPPPPPRPAASNGGVLVALVAALLALVAVASQLPRAPQQGGDVSALPLVTTAPDAPVIPPPVEPPPLATEAPPAVEPGPATTSEAAAVEPVPVTTELADPIEPPDELPPDELPPDLPPDELPPLDTPPTTTEPAATVPTPAEVAPPPAPDAPDVSDAVTVAIDQARGDPDKIALLVRQISLELFTDVPRGRAHFEQLIARSGWSPSPLRDRFVEAMQAVLLVFEPVDGWDERQRRLERVAYLTRERVRASDIERLKAAIDAELARWCVFAAGAPRVRLALGDPRTDDQALRSLEALPDDCFVREDARALLAMGRAADQPDRWVRIDERRAEVALAVRELRERVARTALALVVAEEATVVARVLERQLDDPHASLPTALLRTWEEGALTVAGQARAVDQSVYLQARRREVPPGAPWTGLHGWSLAVALGSPITGDGGVTLTIEDRLTVHLGAAGVVVGGSFTRCDLTGATTVLIEPRFDGMLLRMPGATPDEVMVRLPERQVGPVRFAVRSQGAAVANLVLVRLPERLGNDPRAVRAESVRRQRQGR